jgi:hypothetical protein
VKKKKKKKNYSIAFDAGSCTGYAVGERAVGKVGVTIVESGCIYTNSSALKGMSVNDKVDYLKQSIRDILVQHKPRTAYMEMLYTFPIIRIVRGRKVVLSKQNQRYAIYWQAVSGVLSEYGIPCEMIDTRRLAKKKLAQNYAKQKTGKSRMSTHEAEAIVFLCWVL